MCSACFADLLLGIRSIVEMGCSCLLVGKYLPSNAKPWVLSPALQLLNQPINQMETDKAH